MLGLAEELSDSLDSCHLGCQLLTTCCQNDSGKNQGSGSALTKAVTSMSHLFHLDGMPWTGHEMTWWDFQ